MRKSWKTKRYQNLNFNRLSRQFRHGAGNYYLSQNSYNKKTRKSLTENLVWYLLLHLIFINVFIKTLTIIPYIGIIRALELLTFD